MNSIKKYAPWIVYTTSAIIICLTAYGLVSFYPPRNISDAMGHAAIICVLSIMIGICSCEYLYWIGDRKKVLIISRYPM